ncbi:diphthine--ammonia ligase [Dehalogenimonas etheniformans]|uniref:ATPase n=1 Tax=Dehalogenimonas etheniformans TaxID=1536648 RepID=A0A2P5P8R5_9CHLR|nr:diphthine--ammonia ligase [Dehalogenimonas etheniformans]PPD58680.1 ATPase [Dehalogenimonas etheniformans]QNT76550.1 diphthine--ammonia ligase [Dehalogenimonas etheniformans]
MNIAKREKVFVSWSGGKDSSMACYRAMQSGLDVCYLASMLTADTGRLFPHFVTAEVLRSQAAAIGIPLFEQWIEIPKDISHDVRLNEYDVKYSEMLCQLKTKGITGGVFGDVSRGNKFAQMHWDRVEDFCRPVGMKPYRPLWDQDREQMIRSTLDLGFKPMIIVADSDMGPSMLGKVLTREMLDQFKDRYEHLPDEKARIYYHTFVVDGPIFKKELVITESEKFTSGRVSYLDIKGVCLNQK